MSAKRQEGGLEAAARDRLILVAFTVVLVGVGIGLRDPWPSDEPRFLLIAQQMLASGDWLIPQRGIELYSHKPPLFFWVEALAIQLFGARIGFLMPALLSAMLVMLMTHDLSLRLYDRRTALWAGFALLALPQFVLIGRSGQIDPLLCLWVTLGVYGVLRYVLIRPQVFWLIAGFMAMGLGVITKGVGFLPLFLLPAVAYGRWRAWRHFAPSRATREMCHWSLAGVAFVAPIALWALAVQWTVISTGDPAMLAYRDDLFFQQTTNRYLGSAYHPKQWWYFIVYVIPIFWLPLVMLLPYLAPRWWSRCKDQDVRILIPMVWVLAVITFFSFSGGKRGIYIAPALPALALCSAPFLEQAFARPWVRLAFYSVSLLLAAGALSTGAYLLIFPPTHMQPLISEYDYNPFAIALVIGVFALPAVLFFGRQRAGHGFLALFTVVWMAYGLLVYPLFNDSRSGRRLMRLAESHLNPGQALGLVGWKEQMMLQATVPVEDFGFSQSVEFQTGKAIQWLAEDKQGRRILLPAGVSSECVIWDRGQSLMLAHGRDWMLIDADAINPGCVTDR